MIYKIEPLDNFFFRSPIPFEKGGETTVLHSIFPPLPSTYAGAFRTLTDFGHVGKHGFKMGLSGVTMDDKFYFPLPGDLHLTDQKQNLQWNVSAKGLAKKTLSNYPLKFIMHVNELSSKKHKKQLMLYMKEDLMNSYLNGDHRQILCEDLSDKLVMESKVGIGINQKSGTAQNQQIYTTLCVRPDDKIKLAVDIQTDLICDQKILKFGGEGKLAHVRKADISLDIAATASESRFFKIYLATPAIFSQGWVPGWIDQGNYTGYFSHRKRSVKIKLISACVERAVPCGGFGYVSDQNNRKTGRPRELRYAVPAGSVYYFEIIKGTYQDAVKLFHQKCISEYRENMGFDYQVFTRSRYCDRGFGYSLVGRLSKEQEEFLNVQ